MPVDIDLLISALDSPEAYERGVAAEALASLGRDAAPATSALIKAARDKDPTVAYLAGQALAKIGTETARRAVQRITVPRLLRQLSHPDDSEKSDAAMSLGELGALAEGAERSLQQLFLAPMSESALHAARALRSIGTPAAIKMYEQFTDQWEEVFIEQLFHRDPAVQDFAAFGLALLDTPNARKALEAYAGGKE